LSWIVFFVVAGAFSVAGVGLALRAARAVRARYQTLLGAVEATQRQLTELRTEQDRAAHALRELGERLTAQGERLARLEQAAGRAQVALEVAELRAELARALAAGSVGPVAGETLERAARELVAEAFLPRGTA
jgi:chromosome segregation ATPase